MEETVRLNRFISMCGVCSRREADRLIGDGRVLVEGQPGTAGMQVRLDQCVLLDGKRIMPQETGHIYALNKPAGYVCTTEERWGDPLVADLIQGRGRLFPMGRLDKQSEGLLLMTNRGDLVNKVMKASNRHEKEYVVTVDKPVADPFLAKMGNGIWLEELQVKTRPCSIWKSGDHEFHIVLTQGLNRQIRRMCKACGYLVTSLRRIRIMNIRLGNLKPGEFRELGPAEMSGLERMVRNSRNNSEPADAGHRDKGVKQTK